MRFVGKIVIGGIIGGIVGLAIVDPVFTGVMLAVIGPPALFAYGVIRTIDWITDGS